MEAPSPSGAPSLGVAGLFGFCPGTSFDALGEVHIHAL